MNCHLGWHSKRPLEKVNLSNLSASAVSHVDVAGDRTRNSLWKFSEDTKIKGNESSVVNEGRIWNFVDETLSRESTWKQSNCRVLQWTNLKDPQNHLSMYCYKWKLQADIFMEDDGKQKTFYTICSVLEGIEASSLFDKTFVLFIR